MLATTLGRRYPGTVPGKERKLLFYPEFQRRIKAVMPFIDKNFFFFF